MKNMRWLVVALTWGLTVPAAWGAALLTRGSTEIAVDGAFDIATEMGTAIELRGKYAYFFWDRISTGARVSMGNNDAMNHIGLGLTGEYNFWLPEDYQPLFGTDFVPFAGVALEYRHAKVFDEKEDAVVLGMEGGVKFFLTDSTAIALSVVCELATEDIFPDDQNATDKDLILQLGIRFCF